MFPAARTRSMRKGERESERERERARDGNLPVNIKAWCEGMGCRYARVLAKVQASKCK